MTTKAELYEDVRKQIASVIAGETSRTARLATASCLLREMFGERFFWTGFYEVDPNQPDMLVVGPYQGTMGCLRIPFGKGVCGAAAATGETQLVADVHAFPGHIACDSRSNSEIVVPVRDADGAVVAFLDVGSTEFGAFDTDGPAGLEAICGALLTSA